MRVPFKRSLVPGDRVRVVKAGRRRDLCTRFGQVSGVEGDTVKIILDCGHPYFAQRDSVILDGNKRCVWCLSRHPADQVRAVPLWRAGELCETCWSELEIDKHVKRAAAAEKLAKPKRRSRK